jgi:hypothetical protein
VLPITEFVNLFPAPIRKGLQFCVAAYLFSFSLRLNNIIICLLDADSSQNMLQDTGHLANMYISIAIKYEST